MKKKIIYELKSLYRDNMRVTGFEFGTGKKSVCIVGSIRGNEIQQLYACSLLVKRLKKMEKEGRIKKGHTILVIPSMNTYSMNIKKRFWPTDNTDINRMFPGYDLGETTQRIAGGGLQIRYSVCLFLHAGEIYPSCKDDEGRFFPGGYGKRIWNALCGA